MDSRAVAPAGRQNARMTTNPRTLPADASLRAWQRYQPWRKVVEPGFWLLFFLLNSTANSITVLMDVQRVGLHFAGWEPAVWEFSSNLMQLALVPAVVAFTRAYPLEFVALRRRLPAYLVASIVWSLLHVAGMVALRKAAYAALGTHYDFGPWLREVVYEYLKDARSFAGTAVIIEGYRLLMRRVQGEASLLQAPDDGPAVEPVDRPERFLVRKLGKEFLVPAADIEWAQASGNYVNLHVRGRDYPLRSTMVQVEERLDPSRFRRVHRSYLVNLDHIDRIEPSEAGDARIVMRDGSDVPCSRRYRAALRPDRAPAAAA